MDETLRIRFKALERRVAHVESGGELDPDRLLELGARYRSAVVEVSRMRSSALPSFELEWMESIVARAHGQVYPTGGRGWPHPLRFLTRTFPQAVAAIARPVLWAHVLFYGAALFAAAATAWDPDLAYYLFDEKTLAMEESRMSSEEGFYMGNFTFSRPASGIVGGVIVLNNMRVAAVVFGLACLGCLPGIAILVFNGMMVGTLCGVAWHYGHLTEFLNVIATHGVIELTAIVLAAAAGLRIGWSVIAPGRRRIADALRATAVDSGKVLLGTLLMLLVAGAIESWVTPHAGPWIRLGTAAASAVALWVYFRSASESPTGELQVA